MGGALRCSDVADPRGFLEPEQIHCVLLHCCCGRIACGWFWSEPVWSWRPNSQASESPGLPRISRVACHCLFESATFPHTHDALRALPAMEAALVLAAAAGKPDRRGGVAAARHARQGKRLKALERADRVQTGSLRLRAQAAFIEKTVAVREDAWAAQSPTEASVCSAPVPRHSPTPRLFGLKPGDGAPGLRWASAPKGRAAC